MASRRDELNAYTFAKKRTVASFLQPSPTGSEEGAPRPLRAVLPGLVVGVVIMAGFGAWGMFKPKVPKGWDEPGKNVIVASESTTRYVVLETDGQPQLHPVLNFASAKLLLDGEGTEIVEVDEAVLDGGDVPIGPTVGIPYAPDRLPDPGEAGAAKRWAVCEQPGAADRSVQSATFVLADRDADAVEGEHRLTGDDVMYVRNEEGKRFLVDARGSRYEIGTADSELLLRSLVGEGRRPQRVTDTWLATFQEGSPIAFPELPDGLGTPAGMDELDDSANRVGMVLIAPTGSGPQHYVVLRGKVVPISDFSARLLLDHPGSLELGQKSRAMEVAAQSFTAAPASEGPTVDRDWPELEPDHVNHASRDTVCSVLRDVDDDGSATLSTWAGDTYPVPVSDGATSAYVTPGSGLLYRQFQGTDTTTGGTFLVTDTGLRYAVQSNADSSAQGAETTGDSEGGAPQNTGDDVDQAQLRLGYQDVEPVPVPAHWSEFLPKGPRLDTTSARQPQGA
ncbi:type VII secretion protein EccB [Streptomyces chumphonensis]|uniref:Type VII secretion protein EccB n=1 Tax=Streptomyces chumphonensis TaxID=1214925 RepID=A0A927F3B4_9ACTN|nr:type VII secretion protein EccB [Streptomyces chumphonensis]MBD3934773.1 type VII secretion protein EccB [Streptomyces chumphonensis]